MVCCGVPPLQGLVWCRNILLPGASPQAIRVGVLCAPLECVYRLNTDETLKRLRFFASLTESQLTPLPPSLPPKRGGKLVAARYHGVNKGVSCIIKDPEGVTRGEPGAQPWGKEPKHNWSPEGAKRI